MRKLVLSLIAAIAVLSGAVAVDNYFTNKRIDALMKAQLTIYVAPPLLDQGGTIIVVANEIPLEQWKTLPAGENPAMADGANEKRNSLKAGDRLFGVVASTKVSIVEFVYPEGGTFGFNLMSTQTASGAHPLQTKEILIGDGPGYKDWETGQDVVWDDYVSTIHVLGPSASEGDSRVVRADSGRIMEQRPLRTKFEGATLSSPTDQQIDDAVVYDEELK